MILGYARCSTQDQSVDIQLEALSAAGCERVFNEKASGTSTDGREELRALLVMLREGDEVICTRLDRLARSVPDLIYIVDRIEQAKATIRFLEQPIETKTSVGRMFLIILGAFAEFETGIRKERQFEGIAAAREAGKYRKHPPRGPSHDYKAIWKMAQAGKTDVWIARELGCTRGTVSRARHSMGVQMAKEKA